MNASDSDRWSRRSRLLFSALLAAVLFFLLIHAYLARYAHPMADDFSYARKDLSSGVLHAAHWEYLHWNGRYTSNLLVLLGPMRVGFDALPLYRSIPVLLILFTVLSCFLVLREMRSSASTIGWSWMAALLWTGLYMHLMPDIAEGFYWYTGSVTYQSANAMVLLLVALGVRAARTKNPFLIAIAMLTAFLVVGFNEVAMFLLVIGAAWMVFLSRNSDARSRKLLYVLFFTILCGALLMILAPGNAGRGVYFPEKHRLWPSIGMSILQTIRFGGTWAFSGTLLLGSALWMLHYRKLADRSPLLANHVGSNPFISASVLAALVFLCVFPAYWSTGMLGQHRTANVACFFFVPAWFIHLSTWLNRYPKLVPAWVPRDRWRASTVLVILFVANLAVAGNSGRAIADLVSGRAQRSDVQLEARYEKLRLAASRPERIARIPLIEDPPKTLYVIDLRDRWFLTNVDYAAWFGLREVHIDSTAQRVPAKSTN